MDRETLRQKSLDAINQAKQFIFGQDELIESIICALACEGHLLIEGLPGLGKTLSVSVMSRLCNLEFKRVQFTPDLLPSDLIGTMVYNQQKEEFSTKFGPIFTQLVLADEINRSPAKVQAALLEAMAERQVTIGDQTYKLKSPFVVMATQNPIEQEGTYPLPEAQLDRFMMKVKVEYPDFDSELSIMDLKLMSLNNLEPLLDHDMLSDLKTVVQDIHVDDKMKQIMVKLVHATRPGSQYFQSKYNKVIDVGVSPRATLWLYQCSKFKALLSGDDHVNPEHLLSVVKSVLGHRLILSYEAQMDQVNVEDVILDLAKFIL